MRVIPNTQWLNEAVPVRRITVGIGGTTLLVEVAGRTDDELVDAVYGKWPHLKAERVPVVLGKTDAAIRPCIDLLAPEG